MSVEETSPGKLKRNLVIAIDGPAGAGKSTLARHLARHFGLLNLETGAMYRALALKALRVEVPLDDPAALERLAGETDISLESGDRENRVLLDGEDVTGQIRNQIVTDAASRVSIYPSVRAGMVKRQQRMAEKGGVVMEGRDIGTVVFPDADLKVYLTASPEARARRRLSQHGIPVEPARLAQEAAALAARDHADSTRPVAPLRVADDAVRLDTTALAFPEQVERIVALARPILTRP